MLAQHGHAIPAWAQQDERAVHCVPGGERSDRCLRPRGTVGTEEKDAGRSAAASCGRAASHGFVTDRYVTDYRNHERRQAVNTVTWTVPTACLTGAREAASRAAFEVKRLGES